MKGKEVFWAEDQMIKYLISLKGIWYKRSEMFS